jgi:hypothetical protein
MAADWETELKKYIAISIKAEQIQRELKAAKRVYALNRPLMDQVEIGMRLRELNEGLAELKLTQGSMSERKVNLLRTRPDKPLDASDGVRQGSENDRALIMLREIESRAPPEAPPPRTNVLDAISLLHGWLDECGASSADLQLESERRGETYISTLLLFTDDDMDELGAATPERRTAIRRALRTMLDYYRWKRTYRPDPE